MGKHARARNAQIETMHGSKSRMVKSLPSGRQCRKASQSSHPARVVGCRTGKHLNHQRRAMVSTVTCIQVRNSFLHTHKLLTATSSPQEAIYTLSITSSVRTATSFSPQSIKQPSNAEIIANGDTYDSVANKTNGAVTDLRHTNGQSTQAARRGWGCKASLKPLRPLQLFTNACPARWRGPNRPQGNPRGVLGIPQCTNS